MNLNMQVPYGYQTATRTLGWCRDWLLAHHHPEYVRRIIPWLESKGGLVGIGGGWRADGSQPNLSGFAPEGKSFHQNQKFNDGFIGAAAVDLVAKDRGDTNVTHDSPTWAMVPAQGSAQAKLWGVHCNISTEAWHCLPVDRTEVLTPDGWVRLAEAISERPEVASWSLDSGAISFAPPLAVTPVRVEEVITLRDGSEATSGHRLPTMNPGGDTWKMSTFGEVEASTTRRWVPAAGWHHGAGLDLSDDELRFLVWIQGDGSIRNGGSIEFQFKKERKIKRFQDLCDRLALDVDFSLYRALRPTGVTRFIVRPREWTLAMLEWLDHKSFSWRLLPMNGDQWAAFSEELFHVDGQRPSDRDRSSGVYWTTDRASIDVVQAIAHLHNLDATIRTYERETNFGHATSFMVAIPAARATTPHRCVFGGDAGRRTETISVRHAEVGCLTTLDDTLVIRQDGRIYIVGNCQPVEIDGWQTWINNGCPSPRKGYPIPADESPPSPPPVIVVPSPSDTSLWATPPGTPSIGPGKTNTSTIMFGWPSGRVSWLQGIIDVQMTGVYDPATVAKMKELQRIAGIVTDGVYGPQTAGVFLGWRGR